ncbi:MAG TPA: hypothetical protein DEV93_02375 [Chloroflexi bacterium]|nr:hypothetical protein [Chloroflexota bacterium]
MSAAIRYWWVNQSNSYTEELRHGCLAAPKRTRGQPVSTWDRVRELQPGDIVLHFCRGLILAIGKVSEPARERPRPYDLAGSRSSVPHWVAKVKCTPLVAPIDIRSIPLVWRTPEDGPFDEHGRPRHGYLFPLREPFVQQLAARFGFSLD